MKKILKILALLALCIAIIVLLSNDAKYQTKQWFILYQFYIDVCFIITVIYSVKLFRETKKILKSWK